MFVAFQLVTFFIISFMEQFLSPLALAPIVFFIILVSIQLLLTSFKEFILVSERLVLQAFK